MNPRIAAALEIDQDMQAARNAARGILATANSLRTAGAAALAERAKKVAATAAEHAAAVDCDSRFPREAIAAARAERLLGIAVPHELGGEQASIADIADVCYALGRACASTAMIYAMHQTKVACLVRHGRTSLWYQLLLRRLGNEQLLFASSTTEGQSGGDLRNSAAPVVRNGSGISLERQATVISYGEAADAIVTTARRSADAAGSDQVLVTFLKEDYALERLVGWDAFGMRGTCSEGFNLIASGAAEQILPVTYDKIHAQTMMPVAHLFWSAAWTGIAAAAVERARGFVRKAAQRSGGTLPPAASHLTRANASLRTLRGLIASAVQRFEAIGNDPAALESIDFQTGMNLLKVNASELAVAAVMSAMQTCGLAGYRNDGEFSIGRHLRDILSSPIMINNDRILANVATASLLSGVPDSLSG
ncbi:MAG TPA: acyl-CoA dehydrogenase family protein [Xanthobacteraceae bacterium]|jgi:acyl-CoA dehydrogenase|nr:acyl-CoA dehydrogenase family protein [Xanthobacteraceae bacterium]